jgi:hypothetical protein
MNIEEYCTKLRLETVKEERSPIVEGAACQRDWHLNYAWLSLRLDPDRCLCCSCQWTAPSIRPAKNGMGYVPRALRHFLG